MQESYSPSDLRTYSADSLPLTLLIWEDIFPMKSLYPALQSSFAKAGVMPARSCGERGDCDFLHCESP